MPTGAEFSYERGNPWGECDRCGFKYRMSELKKEWTGLLVCPPCFEPKHPQLSLRAKRDRISVPNARPSQSGTPILVGNLVYTNISSTALTGANSIEVDSISGMADGYRLYIQTDEGAHWTTISGVPSGTTIVFTERLPCKVSIDNLVHANDGTTANQVARP